MSQVLLHAITTQKGDWTIRLDPRHGSKHFHRRHVHLSKKGLKGDYSWNDDGSRHDEHRFPKNDQCIKKAKQLASDALSIPISSITFVTAFHGGGAYKFHSGNEKFWSYIRTDQIVCIFEYRYFVVTVIVNG